MRSGLTVTCELPLFEYCIPLANVPWDIPLSYTSLFVGGFVCVYIVVHGVDYIMKHSAAVHYVVHW